MTPALLLSLVLLAAFAAASLALAGVLALAWRLGLSRLGASSLELFILRLSPAVGALVITLAAALPAFLSFEPRLRQETAGPWLIALAALALALIVAGIWRGWRACRGARALLRRCRCDEPLIGVIGA